MTDRFMSSLVTPLRAEQDDPTFPLAPASSSFRQFSPEEANKAKQTSNLCSDVRTYEWIAKKWHYTIRSIF